jgi:hypothetical protein
MIPRIRALDTVGFSCAEQGVGLYCYIRFPPYRLIDENDNTKLILLIIIAVADY